MGKKSEMLIEAVAEILGIHSVKNADYLLFKLKQRIRGDERKIGELQESYDGCKNLPDMYGKKIEKIHTLIYGPDLKDRWSLSYMDEADAILAYLTDNDWTHPESLDKESSDDSK